MGEVIKLPFCIFSAFLCGGGITTLGVRFMPTGGVTTANVMEYLSVKEVVAVGGTWLGKADDTAAGNWDKIRETVKQAVALKEGK